MNLPDNLFVEGFTNTGQAIDINQLAPIRKFIKDNFMKSTQENIKRNSYWFKEVVAKRLNIKIENGVFIAAMIMEGYNYKVMGRNAVFNVLESSIKILFADSVLSPSYQIIKLLSEKYSIQIRGANEFTKIIKHYNNFEMPVWVRLQKILADKKEAIRFSQFILVQYPSTRVGKAKLN